MIFLDTYITNSDLDKNIATLATKAEFKADLSKIVNPQEFDSNYFGSKNNFEDDGT